MRLARSISVVSVVEMEHISGDPGEDFHHPTSPSEVPIGGNSPSAIVQAQQAAMQEHQQMEARQQVQMQRAIEAGMREREEALQTETERRVALRKKRLQQQVNVQNTVCTAVILGGIIYLTMRAYTEMKKQ